MKKWRLFLSLFAAASVLAGCAGAGGAGSSAAGSGGEAVPAVEVPRAVEAPPAEELPAVSEGESKQEAPEEGSLGALYLRVLEDLWAVDSALNENITMIGMDLTETSLTEDERGAVAQAFAAAHEKELVEGTWQELCDRGYIDGENLYWEDGCHFSITEQPLEGTYNLNVVSFDAQKWRSGLGAYIFCDCTSTQSALGVWGDYAIGAEAIA